MLRSKYFSIKLLLLENGPQTYSSLKDNFTPSRGTLSISKARRLLKYSPAYDLKKGFNNYISWYKKILKK